MSVYAGLLAVGLGLSLGVGGCEWGDPKSDNADATAGPDIQIECAQRPARAFGALPKGVGDTEVEVQCLRPRAAP